MLQAKTVCCTVFEILMPCLVCSQPRTGTTAGQLSREATLWEAASRILERIPPLFDIADISARFPTQYEESMNTILVQECMRFNKLTAVVRQSLIELQVTTLVGAD